MLEDDDNMFRFDYSPEFKFDLQPPGWHKDKPRRRAVKSSNKLVAVQHPPSRHINIYEKSKKMVEIQLFCACPKSCEPSG